MNTTSDVRLNQTCPLCGGAPSPGPTYEGIWSLVWCAPCDLMFLRSGPDGERLTAKWTTEKYKNQTYHKDYLSADNPYRREIVQFLDAIGRYSPAQGNRGVFCDIGCSTGIALAEAKRRGYLPLGVEISEEAGRIARETVGCQVLAADIFDLVPGMLPPVDVLYLNHTLEHFPDPLASLTHLKSLSAPGSLLWINVPNVHGWQRNMLAWCGKTSSLALGEHFCYFSPRSLGVLLRRAGYECLWQKKIYFDWHWKFLPLQAASRLSRQPDGLALIARRTA